jgi:hypothetical protein
MAGESQVVGASGHSPAKLTRQRTVGGRSLAGMRGEKDDFVAPETAAPHFP